VCNIYIYIYIQ